MLQHTLYRPAQISDGPDWLKVSGGIKVSEMVRSSGSSAGLR